MTLALIAGPIPRAVLLPRVRRPLSPWSPSQAGPYTLPRDVLERLAVALRDYRNRDAALALALFLARFWSSPTRLVQAFPIDRRALTDHAALGLTEARVRGAIAALEAIGFLDRDMPAKGSRYRATEHGLRRKPVTFRFGPGYREAFARANGRSKAARGAPAPARRPIAPALPIAPRPETAPAQVAQKQNPTEGGVIMGERPELDSGLAAALTRWEQAIERESRSRVEVSRDSQAGPPRGGRAMR